MNPRDILMHFSSPLRVLLLKFHKCPCLKLQILEAIVLINKVFPNYEIIIFCNGVNKLKSLFKFNDSWHSNTDTATDNNEVLMTLLTIVKNYISLFKALNWHLSKGILKDSLLMRTSITIWCFFFSLRPYGVKTSTKVGLQNCDFRSSSILRLFIQNTLDCLFRFIKYVLLRMAPLFSQNSTDFHLDLLRPQYCCFYV